MYIYHKQCEIKQKITETAQTVKFTDFPLCEEELPGGKVQTTTTRPSALGMSDPIMDHCYWLFPGTTMSMSSCPTYPGVGEVALRYVALVHHGPPLYDYWLSCWILFLLTAIKGCLSEFNIFLWTTTFESTRNQNSWVKNNSFSSWADDYQKDPIHLKREIIMLDIARKWLKRRRCGNVDKWSVRNESALLFTG